MKMLHKFTGSLLAMCMAVQMLVVPAFAAGEKPVYLALGDSISTGYGLEDKENQGFVGLIGAQLDGHTVVNKAVDGYTTSDVYELLLTGQLDADIANADLITITCGGNDMMKVLYERVTGIYNEGKAPEEQITAEDVPDIINGTHENPNFTQKGLVPYALDAIVGDKDDGIPALADSEEFQAGLEEIDVSLMRVMEYIRALNPDAVIVAPTQYNPYLSFYREMVVGTVYNSIENCIPRLNEVIERYAAQYGYVVSDVCGAFKAVFDQDTTDKKTEYKQDSLCNSFFYRTTGLNYEVDFDFHPNIKGHALIAQTMMDTIETVYTNEEREPRIVSSDLSAGTVTFEGTATYSSVAVAFYNGSNKMIGFDMQALNGSENQTALSADLSGTAASGKVFFFQRGSLIPHIEALGF